MEKLGRGLLEYLSNGCTSQIQQGEYSGCKDDRSSAVHHPFLKSSFSQETAQSAERELLLHEIWVSLP